MFLGTVWVQLAWRFAEAHMAYETAGSTAHVNGTDLWYEVAEPASRQHLIVYGDRDFRYPVEMGWTCTAPSPSPRSGSSPAAPTLRFSGDAAGTLPKHRSHSCEILPEHARAAPLCTTAPDCAVLI